jgi:hypothetical protein
MSINFDLSLNTLIVSGVVAMVGWSLRGLTWMFVEAVQKLIKTLIETIARVEVLNAKMDVLTKAVGDVQRIRDDLNGFYDRLRKIEAEFKNGSGH